MVLNSALIPGVFAIFVSNVCSALHLPQNYSHRHGCFLRVGGAAGSPGACR